ncbi:hypothetical protein JCM3770_002971 [Rhodotorula araucariae]
MSTSASVSSLQQLLARTHAAGTSTRRVVFSPPVAPPGSGAATTPRAARGGRAQRARGRIPSWESVTLRGEAWRAADEDEERVEAEAAGERVLWQAGTDHLDPPGPLLVIACSRIPPPNDVSHPQLLASLRRRVEAYAQTGPYSLVLLVNPTPHAPTTAHLVSAYLSLSRASRKNVRRLYVVGGGWWTRVILGIFSATLLSAKSANKLVQCPNLSSLAAALGAEAFVQIDFPLEVYSANTASERDIVLQQEDVPKTFGISLEKLMGSGDDRVPPVVRDCLDVLYTQGPESLGIFRRSPSAAHVAHLRGAYDRGHPVALATLSDAPYLAASLLKLFLRELPTPLLPRGAAWDAARSCPTSNDAAAVAHIRAQLLPLLPPPALTMLQHLLEVLSAISARAETNLMSPPNLVVCVCPALIGGLGDMPTREELEMCRVPEVEGVGAIPNLRRARDGGGNTVGGVLRVMIERYGDLFPPSPRADLSPDTLQLDAASSSSSAAAISPQPSPPSASRSAASVTPAVAPVRARSISHSSVSSTASFLSSASTASIASSHRSAASRRSTLKLKRQPPRAGTGAHGPGGFLVEVFREDIAAHEHVQRVQAIGELTPRQRDCEEGPRMAGQPAG